MRYRQQDHPTTRVQAVYLPCTSHTSKLVTSMSRNCAANENYFLRVFLKITEEGYTNETLHPSTFLKTLRKKQRNKKREFNQGELDALEYHMQVKDEITVAVNELCNIGKKRGYFVSQSVDTPKGVRFDMTSTERPEFDTLLELGLQAKHETQQLKPLNLKDDCHFSEEMVINRIVSNNSTHPLILTLTRNQYIIPAESSFLLSDVSCLNPLLNYVRTSKLFDLAVLDPPWYNKSVKRGAKYSALSFWQIKSLPIPQLMADEGMVIVWVTNKQKYVRFTKYELFPHWSVDFVAEWHWVKVTRQGELVVDMNSAHKKPYEILILGRYKDKRCRTTVKRTADESSSLSHQEQKKARCTLSEFFKSDKKKSNKSVLEFDSVSSAMSDNEVCAFLEGTVKSDEMPITPCGSNMFTIAKHSQTTAYTTLSDASVLLSCKSNSFFGGSRDGSTIDTINKRTVQTFLNENPESQLPSFADLTGSTINARLTNENDEMGPLRTFTTTSEVSSPNDGNSGERQRDSMSQLKNEKQAVTMECINRKHVPQHQVICSVPCVLHSRKPPLGEVLADFLPPKPNCLEMFARNLTPGWTSWGNEVLKFQNVNYFVKKREDSDSES